MERDRGVQRARAICRAAEDVNASLQRSSLASWGSDGDIGLILQGTQDSLEELLKRELSDG